jgi:hypothetical protein
MRTWEWWNVEYPLGTIAATAREKAVAVAWAAANVPAGAAWALRRWTISERIEAVGSGPPPPPQGLRPPATVPMPLPSQVHVAPGMQALP